MTSITADDKAVSVGRPIANTRIYIVDSHLQPAPIGVPGELYIGGDGLSRGYLNRPELTADKFIRNPFSDDPTSRLCRTGDLAKYRADRNIEFLGRIDNQVKICGHRIELGEIEATLNQHPAVKETVIVVREHDSSGEKTLIGYVVPKVSSALSITELRRFLKETLPVYMIPSVFISVEALTLTPNGKINRQSLPAPDGERPELDEGFVEPRTEIEELIARVWREILRLDKIGVYDNFFELGGHSLLAVQIIARVREVFDKDVPLLALFDAPRI